MKNKWSNRNDEAAGIDKQIAATLAAALIARGYNMPAASNAALTATQAVDIYREVLEKLRDVGEKPNAE